MNRLETINNRLHKIEQMMNDSAPIRTGDSLHVGVDLGTASIVIVVTTDEGEPVAAFMEWAEVVRDGIVLDYWGATQIVKKLAARAEQRTGQKIKRVITSFPPGTEPMISENVIKNAGLEVESMIDEPSSVSALLNINEGIVVDIGGGTTGMAFVRDGLVKKVFDEPTGGRHVTLTIAGNQKISLDEAEKRKTGPMAEQLKPIVEPVFQKMADIIAGQMDSTKDTDIYLAGGTCCFPGFDNILGHELQDNRVIKPYNPLFLTPLAISSYRGTHESK